MSIMMRIAGLAVLAFVLMSGVPNVASAQDAGDSQADRLAAAQKLIKVQRMETMVDEMVNAGAKRLPPADQEAYRRELRQEIDIAALETAAINAMVKVYTAREMTAMAAFYGSPEGQAIQRKTSQYMTEFMPALQSAMIKVTQRYMEQRRAHPAPR